MGKGFGHLYTQMRGILFYELSHHEQRPFGKWWEKIPNTFWHRPKARMFTWLPPFLIGYAIYRYVEWSHKQSLRKNPKDFAREIEPPPPRICRKPKEPLPFCKKDWEYDEYECAPDEEPNPDYFS